MSRELGERGRDDACSEDRVVVYLEKKPAAAQAPQASDIEKTSPQPVDEQKAEDASVVWVFESPEAINIQLTRWPGSCALPSCTQLFPV